MRRPAAIACIALLLLATAFVTGAGPMKARHLIHVANTDEPGGNGALDHG